MTTIDPNTLDPEEIRALPMRRDLPYNGLTEAQVRAIGADPAEVEAGRLASAEWRRQQSVRDDAQLVLAAHEAVASGEMMNAEAALALRNAGHLAAEAAFVQEWNEQEQRDAAEDVKFLDAEEYVRETTTMDAHVRAETQEKARQLLQELDAQTAEQIKARLDATVPVGDPLRAGIEAAIVHQLTEAGEAPSDAEGQNNLIRGAVRRADVIDEATQSIRQQAEQEWRILRKTQGKSGALMTSADIESAKNHYITGRLQQLGDARLIDHDDLKAPPTAGEEQARYLERFTAQNERSTSLHTAVGDIEKRGRDAEAARRQGGTTYGSGSQQDRYRASVRRAEENARVGEARTSENAPQSRNPDRPDLPANWADEYGPAGFRN